MNISKCPTCGAKLVGGTTKQLYGDRTDETWCSQAHKNRLLYKQNQDNNGYIWGTSYSVVQRNMRD